MKLNQVSLAVVLVVSVIVPMAPALGQGPSDPNVPIFDAYFADAVRNLPGGTLPGAFDQAGPLHEALWAGLPGLAGLTPGSGWCASVFLAYQGCASPASEPPSVLATATGPSSVSACQGAVIGSPAFSAVQSMADPRIVPGAIEAYLVFFHTTGAAPFVAYRTSDVSMIDAPTSACTSLPNSTGRTANIAADGLNSVSLNDFRLRIWDAPPGASGLFFYGDSRHPVPFGDGVLCVGGASGVFRLGNPATVGNGGALSKHIDFTVGPAGTGASAVIPGSLWTFQFWYRDGAAGGAGFNASSALEVSFCE